MLGKRGIQALSLAQLLIKTTMLKNKDISLLTFKLSGVVFIMLINVKNVQLFNIYEHDKYHAQLS